MRRVILAIVTTAVGLVLLLSFKTHSSTGLASTQSPVIVTPTTGSSGESSKTGSSGSGGSTSSSSGSAASSAAAKTVAGDEVQTIYGPIQVTITVKGGKITAVDVPVYPNGTMRDVQINSFALPQLVQETISANGASIDGVSGATYTSQGYVSSLQSALDKAR
jgi:uncharacterized protein with FMN-binding domain